MKKVFKKGIVILFVVGVTFAQTDSISMTGIVPDFNAQLSFGFNYDFLKNPLKVSFDYPKGYFSINIPLTYSPPKTVTGSLTDLLAEQFEEGEEFEPTASAKQNANTTIKVDIPMMGGVASFSNMQMMYLRYANTLGLPNLRLGTAEGADMGLLLRGMVSVPIDLQIGWETMTFGYAYQVNKMLKFAFNLHRHVFKFDVKGKIGIDLLGNFSINIEDEATGQSYEMKRDIEYSLNNVIDGHYEVERWTPTFAVKYWRVSLISRFGMTTTPRGFLTAKYSLPFFINPETFTVDEGLADSDQMQNYLTDNLDKFLSNETNEIEYSTNTRMKWNLPQAHSLMFDIVPDKLSLSYTKLFGKIEMELFDPVSDKVALQDPTNYPDTLDFRFSASVDHVLLLHGSFYSSFFNLGIYSMDFSFRDRDDLLQNVKALKSLKFGDGVMTPILNLGALIGSKIQVLVELDVLPLLALKTGIVYYF